MEEGASKNNEKGTEPTENKGVSQCHMDVDASMMTSPIEGGRRLVSLEETIDPVVVYYRIGFGSQGEAVPGKDHYPQNEKRRDKSEETR